MTAPAKNAPSKPQSKKSSRALRNNLIAYSFIAPNFIGFCVFTLVPMVFAIALSLCSWDGAHPIEFVGLKNFADLLNDHGFKNVAGRAKRYFSLSRKSVRNRCGCRRNVHFD